MLVVTEPGLYRIVMASRHQQAERFQDWVTDEVLPAIRKAGSYSVHGALPDFNTMDPKALALVHRLSSAALSAVGRADAAEAKVAALEPPARAWEAMADTRRDYSVGDAAKILSRDEAIDIGEQRLFKYLVAEALVFVEMEGTRRNRKAYKPYQHHVDAGRFALRLGSRWRHPDTGEWHAGIPQLRITAKGMAFLHRRLGGVGALKLDGEDPPASDGKLILAS